LLPGGVLGQSSPTAPTRDPAAVALAGQALRALAGIAPLNDITLEASATYTAGSDEETGTATLVAKACSAGLALQPCGSSSLVTLNLSGGPRQEIRNGPAGVWSGPDGAPHAMAQHNALVPAAWFFPVLVLADALNDPSVQLAHVGQEMKGDVSVEHLRLWRALPSALGSDPSFQLFQHLTSVDVYLAAANSLPVAVDFNVHPDDNAGLDIAVEVQYSNYQKSGGMLLPAHIQKFINNALLLDLNIASVAVNSGVAASAFALPSIAAGGGQ
jgi:hypothetical protein